MDRPTPHVSVLLREVLETLQPAAGGVYIDATLGPGGHAEALLDAADPSGRVLGIDRDPSAISAAKARLARFGGRFSAIHGDHRDVVALARSAGVFTADGVIADLGVSSLQLDDPTRGLSFRADGPLDMRLDPTADIPTAADLIRDLSERELGRIFRDYGEERLFAKIARAIARRRDREPIGGTRDLAEIIERASGPAGRHARIHPATRCFQALRIAVNGEIEGLEAFISDAVSLLRRGGRLCVISFHSLEDRVVKLTMRGLAERCICPPRLPVCGCGRENLVRILTPTAVRPTRDEIETNPRARSAKLRAVERI